MDLPEIVTTEGLGDDYGTTLLRMMQCYSCGYFGIGSLWKCDKDHNLCDNCIQRMELKCPCVVKLGNTESPCGSNIVAHPERRIYEALVDACTFTCVYKKFGCKAVAQGSVYQLHTAYCQFRPDPIVKSKSSSLVRVVHIVKRVEPEFSDAQKKLPFIQYFPEDQDKF